MFDVKEKKAHIVATDKKLVDWLLSMNKNNRNLRKKHVMWLEKAIAEKEFILTGQGIAVSKKGVLLDGQHRLIAIANAGYPSVELLVVTGLDDKAQMYVDQHAKRTVADMLKLTLDKTISNQMAAALVFLTRLETDADGFCLRGSGRKPSLQEIHNKMSESMEDLVAITDACGQRVRTGAVAAIYDYYIKYNKDSAIEFALQVRDGEMLKKTDPAYVLRRYLATHTNNGGSQSLETYRFTVSACIAHAKSRRIESFRPSNSWSELSSEFRSEIRRKKYKKVA